MGPALQRDDAVIKGGGQDILMGHAERLRDGFQSGVARHFQPNGDAHRGYAHRVVAGCRGKRGARLAEVACAIWEGRRSRVNVSTPGMPVHQPPLTDKGVG